MASNSTVRAAGTARGQRKLNGAQTTGREYRSLSEPEYGMRRDDDVPVPMRDGVRLLADVHRPDSDGRFPALIAASPYPRSYRCLGTGLNRVPADPAAEPPSQLTWTSAPLDTDVDMVGDIELRLTATATAADTAWIAVLQDVDTTGGVSDVTAGWLRASVREVDEAASRPGAPVLRCRTAEAVSPHEPVNYRIPVVPNARRFAAGHCIRLVLTSDDQPKDAPAIMEFRHASVGTSTTNTISSASRLLFPVLEGSDGGLDA
jgi:predicted acyl esterase